MYKRQIFILAAYGVTFVAVAALALAIVEDDRKQRRLLAELEQRGIRRRSAQLKPASIKPASTKAPSTKPKSKRKAAP